MIIIPIPARNNHNIGREWTARARRAPGCVMPCRPRLSRVAYVVGRRLCTRPPSALPPPPSPPPTRSTEVLAAGATSFAGIGTISFLHFGLEPSDLTMVLGSMGASAVLLYAAPEAPFSQPRNLFGGHLLACLVGVSCHELISVPMGTPMLAAPLAVSSTIMLMMATHTVHPPAGGTVLIAVLGSPELHALGYQLLVPTALDASILFGVALSHNALGRTYPTAWRARSKCVSKTGSES